MERLVYHDSDLAKQYALLRRLLDYYLSDNNHKFRRFFLKLHRHKNHPPLLDH
jgi:hypothetical protein